MSPKWGSHHILVAFLFVHIYINKKTFSQLKMFILLNLYLTNKSFFLIFKSCIFAILTLIELFLSLNELLVF